MELIAPLIVVTLLAGGLSLVLTQGFGKSVPFALVLASLVLYVAGLTVGRPDVGVWVLVALAMASAVALGVTQRGRTVLTDTLHNPVFLAFLLLYAGVTVLDLARSFTIWDEWSHWGMMVKEMVRLNVLYSEPASLLVAHKDYPPIMQLMQYLWCFLSGGYTEMRLYRCLHFFLLSLTLPVAEELLVGTDSRNGHAYLRGTLATCAMLLATYLLAFVLPPGKLLFLTAYNDPALALLFGFGLWCVLSFDLSDRRNAMLLGAFFAFFLLCKQIDVVLYALYLCVLLVRLVAQWHASGQEGGRGLLVPAAVLDVGAPLGTLLLWSAHTRALGITGQFDTSKLSIPTVVGVILGRADVGEEWQHQTLASFIDAVLHRPLISYPLELSYPLVVLLAMLVVAGLAFLARHLGRRQHARTLWLGVAALALGAGLYAGVLMVSYLFGFQPDESLRLASFDRYIGAYAQGSLYAALLLALQTAADTARAAREAGASDENASEPVGHLGTASMPIAAACALVACALLTNPHHLRAMLPDISPNPEPNTAYDAAWLQEMTEDGVPIYLIDQGSDALYEFLVVYYAENRPTNLLRDEFSIDESDGLDLAALADAFTRYDYVWLKQSNDYLVENYGDLFEQAVADNTLWRVDHQTGHLTLIGSPEVALPRDVPQGPSV